MGCGSAPAISQMPPGITSPGGATAAPAVLTSAPPTVSTPVVGSIPPPGAQPAPPATTTASAPAVDATAGANGGGPLASTSGTGGALAGATGAVSVDQLVPQLQDIIAKITALVQQLSAVAGGGASAAPAADASGATTGGGGASASAGGCCGAADAAAGADPSQTADPAQVGQSTLDTGGAAAAPEVPDETQAMAKTGPAKPAAPADTSAADSARIAKWVTGDTKGLNPKLLSKLAQVGEHQGTKIKIDSGFRSHDEQVKLYNLYLAGKGNLAAKPGTSNHESGNAADVSIGGTSLRNDAKAAAYAKSIGLTFPVPSEAWHTELAK